MPRKKIERCEHGNVAAYCIHCHPEPTDKMIGTLVCHRCGSVVKYDEVGVDAFRERFMNFGAKHGEGKCAEEVVR